MSAPAPDLVADILERVAEWAPELAASPRYHEFLRELPPERLRRIHRDTLAGLPRAPQRIVHRLRDRHGRVPRPPARVAA